MRQEEKIMFEYFKSIVEDYGVDLTQSVIKVLPDEMVRNFSPEQHNRLTTHMQDEVIKIIQSVLAIFDNVGFTSPPEMEEEPVEILKPEDEVKHQAVESSGTSEMPSFPSLEDNFEKSWVNYATQQFQFKIPSKEKDPDTK